MSVVVRRSPRWVKRGGWLLLEVGADQVAEVTAMFTESGYGDLDLWEDADGDPRRIWDDWAVSGCPRRHLRSAQCPAGHQVRSL